MFKKHYETAVCADGFSVSIQASSTNYCSPRNNEGPYIRVELGFPSEKDSILLPYAEDSSNPTETVYGYVPSAVVLECLELHGGWVSGEIPPMIVHAEEEV